MIEFHPIKKMPFLIDGHNLIPHISGISLDQLDDETRLVDILEAYFRRQRKKAIVFFDRGQPGIEPNLKRGFVKAHFTRSPLNADQAIRGHLRKLGGAARNYTVISSDNEVAAYAQQLGAKTLSSHKFAELLDPPAGGENPSKSAPQDGTDYWLSIFGEDS